MKEQPNLQTIILSWIEKADHDLINAEHTIQLKDNCPYDTICFHAQQCVEKYIKALLIYHKIAFPKTHDMEELIELLPTSCKIILTAEEKSKLSDYAVASRYPVDGRDDLSSTDAEEALRLAKKIRRDIRDQLDIAD